MATHPVDGAKSNRLLPDERPCIVSRDKKAGLPRVWCNLVTRVVWDHKSEVRILHSRTGLN